MRPRIFSVALVLLGAAVAPAAAPPPVDGARIAALVRALDADDFAVRQRAEARLRDLGVSAVPSLRKALAESRSPEQRRRLTRLLAYPENEPLRLRVRE